MLLEYVPGYTCTQSNWIERSRRENGQTIVFISIVLVLSAERLRRVRKKILPYFRSEPRTD